MALARSSSGEWDVVRKSNNIYDFFDNFTFPRELITRYLLSLTSKPFVLLTGISGTGKTKIAQVFAEFILQNQEEEVRESRKKFIPVRPDWMDNRGLLGFYNLLDESYHSTPLMELLLTANGESNAKIPFFAILDEMNLARVEQYFSDFLSIMESRTPDNQDGEWLILHPFGENKPAVANYSVPSKIRIPMNLFFTGTVNVDESTYMFSPKVLDRANVIEFNDVLLDRDHPSELESRFVLRRDMQSLDAVSGMLADRRLSSLQDFEEAIRMNGSYLWTLEQLISLLREYNLHFGYRVINEISRFLLNARKYVANYVFEEAFDIQVLQKILPKYHGTQAKLQEPLEKFLAFCFSENDKYSDDLLQMALKGSDGARFPRSAKKLAQMLRSLNAQGYCSFIE